MSTGLNRLSKIISHLSDSKEESSCKTISTRGSKKETLSIRDNRTGKSYTISIQNGTINSSDFKQIKIPNNPIGLRTYDPAYLNTSSATSRITWIDGPKGILLYRGYPIEELAAKSTFLEVAYLLIYGELPTKKQLEFWQDRVMKHTFVHSDIAEMMESFRYDAHPMGMLVTSLAALGTVHPEVNPALQGQDIYNDIGIRNKVIHRAIGTVATLAAYSYRHRSGRPYTYPSHQNLSYTENFLYMIDKYSNNLYKPNSELAKALDILFILHADHELNCSTSAMRHLTSSGVDVYTSLAASAGALYGPRHGGANEAVLKMLEKIGDKKNIPSFIQRVKSKKEKLMGFGHRVYKNYDPRAKIVRKIADKVFNILGKEPLIEIAEELEKVALSDSYFIKRNLYPNVDFYSGLIYKAMGFPTDFFTVLFAIPRTVGWLAHWNEFLDDKENKIVRPRQVYLGEKHRPYIPLHLRDPVKTKNHNLNAPVSAETRRRFASNVRP